jgi:hypothetical protein
VTAITAGTSLSESSDMSPHRPLPDDALKIVARRAAKEDKAAVALNSHSRRDSSAMAGREAANASISSLPSLFSPSSASFS